MMEAHIEPVSQGSELYPHSDSKCAWEDCTQGLGRAVVGCPVSLR